MNPPGESLDLRTIPAVVISLVSRTDRRAHITSHFGDLGLDYRFIDGVTGEGKNKAVTLAFRKAFDAMKAAPFLIFEDDVRCTGTSTILPAPPADADVIYLGTNFGGMFRDDAEHRAWTRQRSVDGFALASDHDEAYMRLHSAVGAYALLFLTEKAVETARRQTRIALNRGHPIDVRFARMMQDLAVYGLRDHLFIEEISLQSDADLEWRRAVTQTPLKASAEGDLRSFVHNGERVTGQVVRAQGGGLECVLVSRTPLSRD